tara:strand:- start:172 stop:519 length:348 start_codon:yes stop_codon:yes gene_type:complete
MDGLGPIYQIKDRKPEEQHGNDKGLVMYGYESTSDFGNDHFRWYSSRWDCIPDDATHWHMCYDTPPLEERGEKNTAKALDQAAFQRLLKKEFPEPTVNNLLIESTLRKFWNHGHE